MQELQEEVSQSQASLEKLMAEQQVWEAQRAELQGQLAAAKKAQALAQSKLVLAKQREAQLKVCTSSGVHLWLFPPVVVMVWRSEACILRAWCRATGPCCTGSE